MKPIASVNKIDTTNGSTEGVEVIKLPPKAVANHQSEADEIILNSDIFDITAWNQQLALLSAKLLEESILSTDEGSFLKALSSLCLDHKHCFLEGQRLNISFNEGLKLGTCVKLYTMSQLLSMEDDNGCTALLHSVTRQQKTSVKAILTTLGRTLEHGHGGHANLTSVPKKLDLDPFGENPEKSRTPLRDFITIQRFQSSRNSALHISALKGDADILQMLIEAMSEKRTRVHLLAFDDALNRELNESQGSEIRSENPLKAIESPSSTTSKDHWVDLRNINGDTPLIFAAGSGSVDCAALLMEAGANVAAANKEGLAPLSVAAAAGDVAMVRQILSAVRHGSRMDLENLLTQTDIHGRTALHYAAATATRSRHVAAAADSSAAAAPGEGEGKKNGKGGKSGGGKGGGKAKGRGGLAKGKAGDGSVEKEGESELESVSTPPLPVSDLVAGQVVYEIIHAIISTAALPTWLSSPSPSFHIPPPPPPQAKKADGNGNMSGGRLSPVSDPFESIYRWIASWIPTDWQTHSHVAAVLKQLLASVSTSSSSGSCSASSSLMSSSSSSSSLSSSSNVMEVKNKLEESLIWLEDILRKILKQRGVHKNARTPESEAKEVGNLTSAKVLHEAFALADRCTALLAVLRGKGDGSGGGEEKEKEKEKEEEKEEEKKEEKKEEKNKEEEKKEKKEELEKEQKKKEREQKEQVEEKGEKRKKNETSDVPLEIGKKDGEDKGSPFRIVGAASAWRKGQKAEGKRDEERKDGHSTTLANEKANRQGGDPGNGCNGRNNQNNQGSSKKGSNKDHTTTIAATASLLHPPQHLSNHYQQQQQQQQQRQTLLQSIPPTTIPSALGSCDACDSCRSRMETIVPGSVKILDLTPDHLIPHKTSLSSLSMAQLEALEAIHRRALEQVQEARIRLKIEVDNERKSVAEDRKKQIRDRELSRC